MSEKKDSERSEGRARLFERDAEYHRKRGNFEEARNMDRRAAILRRAVKKEAEKEETGK